MYGRGSEFPERPLASEDIPPIDPKLVKPRDAQCTMRVQKSWHKSLYILSIDPSFALGLNLGLYMPGNNRRRVTHTLLRRSIFHDSNGETSES